MWTSIRSITHWHYFNWLPGKVGVATRPGENYSSTDLTIEPAGAFGRVADLGGLVACTAL